MKNSILTLMAVAAMVACEKSDTTNVNKSADSLAAAVPASSEIMGNDSATMSNTKSSLSDQDKKFADVAAMGGMMEVMAGKLAASNTTNATVKALGEMMVKDHTKGNEELKKWASTVSYTLPTNVDAEMQKVYDNLKAKKGMEFDRMFTDLMVSDHQKVIAAFKKEASEGKETSLKSFATNTLPTLEHHLMESEKAKAAVK